MAKISDSVRANLMEKIGCFLTESGETVLQVKSNTYSIPWAEDDAEGYINITFVIPKGSRDGTPFDGFEEAGNYKLESEAKAAAKAEREEKKKKKIEKDKAAREKKKTEED